METLFGLPVDDLLVFLIAAFLLGTAIMVVVALRNRVIFKMAVRNIPRRRAQTALIVLGLMLATLLFSASFATGDTLAHSIRVQALGDIGAVDVVLSSQERDVTGQTAYFDADVANRVRTALADAPVAGVTPAIAESVPAVSPATQRNEPGLAVRAFDPSLMDGFDSYRDAEGSELPIDALGRNEVYLTDNAADSLRVDIGDSVLLFFGQTPTEVTVLGIIAEGANAAEAVSAVMRLADVQDILGRQGQVNRVYISNEGGLVESARHTDAVQGALVGLAAELGLDVDPVKQDALDEADLLGSTFASIFLLFGNFSIIAGVLLIFLIFVMLAAERKRELGIARAVGGQRGHIVRLFAFEGALYSLMAAAVGSILGVVVGFGMVRIIAGALGTFDLTITFAFRWQSLAIAYTLGMFITFVVVVFSSVRASNLNIVRAVRDIPEPPHRPTPFGGLWKAPFIAYGRGLRQMRRLRVLTGLQTFVFGSLAAWLRLIAAAFMSGWLMAALGVLLAVQGVSTATLSTFLVGLSLVVIGVPLLLKHTFRLNERIAYTVAGVLLVALWILPIDFQRLGLPDFQQGIELFILSGVMLVIGAVWVVMYNAPLQVRWLSAALGRGRTLAPIVRTAAAYPLSNRFRTGMTLAMFSLVVFTLMVVGFIIATLTAAFEDIHAFSGGFDVTANVSPANPIQDLSAAIQADPSLDANDFDAIGSRGGMPARVRQQDSGGELVDTLVSSVDRSYADAVTYGFSLMDPRYADADAVWRALMEEPNTAVVSSFVVPSRSDFNVGGPPVGFQLEGFYREDGVLPEVYVEVFDPTQQRNVSLRVIGVLEDSAFFAGNITTAHDTLQQLAPVPLPFFEYSIRLREPERAMEMAQALEDAFVNNGMRALSLEQIVREQTAVNITFNRLIQGFMGLGLVVGIAALGVIAARSVVERRQQIGMLRAIGFQRGMVQLSFLMESSLIALLGTFIGMALAFGLSASIINEIGRELEGVSYRVPWSTTAIVFVVAYGASLLTTFLPARQAANVYPAEALRFAE